MRTNSMAQSTRRGEGNLSRPRMSVILARALTPFDFFLIFLIFLIGAIRSDSRRSCHRVERSVGEGGEGEMDRGQGEGRGERSWNVS